MKMGFLLRGLSLAMAGAMAAGGSLVAYGLQNPGAQWRHAVRVVEEMVVPPPLLAPLAGEQGWAIQIGAYKLADTAELQLRTLAKDQGDLLADAAPIVEPVDLPGGLRLYRARFGPFTREQADDLCRHLTARGRSCVIMAQAPLPAAPRAAPKAAQAGETVAASKAGPDGESIAAPGAAAAPAATTATAATAHAPTHTQAPTVQTAKADRLKALDDAVLANMRGGFFMAGGVQFDFGASVRTMVNGELALQSVVHWTPQGASVQQVAGPGTTPVPADQLADLFGGSTGPGTAGVTIPAPSGSTTVLTNLASGQVQNVLLNTASNQRVVQNTDVLLTIYNLPQLQQQIGQQLLSMRLANDAAAAGLFNH